MMREVIYKERQYYLHKFTNQFVKVDAVEKSEIVAILEDTAGGVIIVPAEQILFDPPWHDMDDDESGVY